MKTRNGMKKIMDRLFDVVGIDNEEATQLLRDINNDYNDRIDIMDKIGIDYDGEGDDYVFSMREEDSGGEWERKYNDLYAKYKERFFTREGTPNSEPETGTGETDTEEVDASENENMLYNTTIEDITD